MFEGITTLTFDCYGTLIDWETGLRRALSELFGAAGAARQAELFDAYLEEEMKVQQEPYRTYREVLALAAERVAARFGIALTAGRSGAVAERVPAWQPFADTNEALTRLKAHYWLGVLSNIDRDLFAATQQHFPIAFDFVITAEDVRSYKPGHAHFDTLLARHAKREEVLHVAQSVYHDGVPARELGIRFAWINRRGERNTTSATPVAEFANLAALTDALCATRADR